jgi:putative Mg2+ transporter-C (MgtC) family protein
MTMPLHPTWQDIAIRLILTIIAGAFLGLNRGVRGHAVGFRTTIIVGLAAAVAMIQANILLSVSGKVADSFGIMDLMRLPLGILTGVGFIGAGTILRQGAFVTGVTTAATLWIMTVIGLCFGGGQLILGLITTVFSFMTLWAFKWIDLSIPRDRRARLVLTIDKTSSIPDINARINSLGYYARFQGQTQNGKEKTLEFDIEWKRSERGGPPIDLLTLLEESYQVNSFDQTMEK